MTGAVFGDGRSRSRRRLFALAIEGLALVLASTAVVVGVGSGAYPELGPLSAVILFGGLWLYWCLGVLIVARVDGHRVGWLFTAAATMLGATFALWSLASIVSDASPALATAWLYGTGALLYTPALILTVPAVAMVFPTGALPGRRWRWAVVLIVGLLALETVAVLLGFTLFNDQEGAPVPTTLPMTIVAPLIEAAIAIGAMAVPVAAVVGLAAIVVRFRRSSGLQRQQLKWFVAAIIPAAILLPLGMTDLGTSFPIISLLSALSFPLAALAVAVSILRYRVYEIDRIISRTIGWAVVTGLLVAVFAVGLIGLQALLDGVTQGETVSVAASTLVAFALFQPVRRRVQRAVDRRFDRARYDGTQTADAFANRLRNEVDLESVTADLRATVQTSVRPVTVGLWLRSSVL